jgi:hypothetical protein
MTLDSFTIISIRAVELDRLMSYPSDPPMNTSTYTALTSSRPAVVVRPRHISSSTVKYLLRPGPDVDTFDHISANCRGPMPKARYFGPGALADRGVPLACPLCSRGHDNHRPAGGKVDLT